MARASIAECPDEQWHPSGPSVIAGDPIHLGARELVPLVGVTGFVRRRALVGTTRVGACGRGFVRLRPLGIVERRDGHQRQISIPDTTPRVLALLTLAAILVPLAVAVTVALARGGERSDTAPTTREPKESG